MSCKPDPLALSAIKHSINVRGHSVFAVVDTATKRVLGASTVSKRAAMRRASTAEQLAVARYQDGMFQGLVTQGAKA